MVVPTVKVLIGQHSLRRGASFAGDEGDAQRETRSVHLRCADVPTVAIPFSPLAGGRSVTISYQRQGDGPPLVFLHGGWGYDIYPIDVAAFMSSHTVIIPSRSGYGESSPLEVFPPDFHSCAVDETLALLDTLGLERAVWWGHSDGAVIAALAAIQAPDRVQAVILEATHVRGDKPRSRAFFEQMAWAPDSFGDRVRRTLAAEHGEDRWRHLVHLDGEAWLDLARRADGPSIDLYGGRLDQIVCPTLVVHGGLDPRSEPGELETLLAALPQARLSFHPDAGHSPHSELSQGPVTKAVAAFLASLAAPDR
jgi:pimeloyl-ACP methyl ester carboxylesterase